MVLLKAKNPDVKGLERTELRVAAAAAATTLEVDATEFYATNDYVVVGVFGTETAEAVRVTAVTDVDTLAVTALVYAHGVNEPVVLSIFNQIRFYSSADSFASNIKTEGVDWRNENQFTFYNDTAGTSSTTYKYAFFNAQTTTESDQSNEFIIPTYYCSVQDVADWMDIVIDDKGELKPHQVVGLIRAATATVDFLTDTSFKSNTATQEYHDGKKSSDTVYFMENRPVISMTTFQTTLSNDSIGPDNATWITLTENDDFTVDLKIGAVNIVDQAKLPAVGDNRVRATYTHGHAVVTDDARDLAVLVVVRRLAKSGITRSLFQGKEGRFQSISYLDQEIADIASKYNFADTLNT